MLQECLHVALDERPITLARTLRDGDVERRQLSPHAPKHPFPAKEQHAHHRRDQPMQEDAVGYQAVTFPELLVKNAGRQHFNAGHQVHRDQHQRGEEHEREVDRQELHITLWVQEQVARQLIDRPQPLEVLVCVQDHQAARLGQERRQALDALAFLGLISLVDARLVEEHPGTFAPDECRDFMPGNEPDHKEDEANQLACLARGAGLDDDHGVAHLDLCHDAC
mmetsp:Transcript_36063/g.92923  ORF Transcript_36063/g.92923 Transcript_36063/m.92923 type:complete len:223 (-) Transcript_36063:553-1221(-)